MKQVKTTMLLAARWLIVLTISLIVLPGHAFAEKPVAAKNTCAASCGAHCSCCVSKAPVSSVPVPLAPSSSTRTVLTKDFQAPSLLNALLLKELERKVLVRSDFSDPHFSISLPLFARHCSFLL